MTRPSGLEGWKLYEGAYLPDLQETKSTARPDTKKGCATKDRHVKEYPIRQETKDSICSHS